MSRSEVRTRHELADRAALDADHGSSYCAVFHRAIELIGRRWNGVIVRALLAGGQRFSDVRAAVPGLSDRLLAERLRELEHEGVVTRACPSSTGGARYSLTAKGQALAPVLDAVSSWAATWVEPGEATSGDGRDRTHSGGGIPGRVPSVGSSADHGPPDRPATGR